MEAGLPSIDTKIFLYLVLASYSIVTERDNLVHRFGHLFYHSYQKHRDRCNSDYFFGIASHDKSFGAAAAVRAALT